MKDETDRQRKMQDALDEKAEKEREREGGYHCEGKEGD